MAAIREQGHPTDARGAGMRALQMAITLVSGALMMLGGYLMGTRAQLEATVATTAGGALIMVAFALERRAALARG